mmetsp:Transcript_60205/g.127537  ORF Transcript_60205/g.127537 Transcript_60205/m.127537 type:complete len:307 (-) Transcript_60205:274-1194(-)|eukprot:CAMPEP_0206542754 /NCGR_PEP_ID=MMETSP0325_2-20121206/10377_1 /ASSEMBLY_ACC=CAM_ASM_000347 /TAXON_ID=2866 /ORGANISM="Crypthecodinium cohnii, Strain Seligo" /LENGTH=306 /DNA_ID=CAMNT_0054040905 /DNA_START=34 /DNA_END=954 /DNA_ORIENTATION=+
MAGAYAYGAASFEEEKKLALRRADHLEAVWRRSDKISLWKEFVDGLDEESFELRDDETVLLARIQKVTTPAVLLKRCTPRVQANKEVILQVVADFGECLAFASEELRGDREVVLEAVRNNPGALQYASEQLRDDEEIVLAALQHGMVLEEAGSGLKQNKEFILRSIRFAPTIWIARDCYKQADECLKNEISFAVFQTVAQSCLAVPGESAPFATASLLPATSPGADACSFEVSLMSGTTFTCSLSKSSKNPKVTLDDLTVNDLAQQIVKNLPQNAQVPVAKRVFLIFAEHDEPVSPWDCKLPLSRF